MATKTCNITVEYSGEYSGKHESIADENIKNKLYVDNILCKHRLSYKMIWDENNPNILTFILFNPSTANQYSNDRTINNCIKLAKNGCGNVVFGGMKIYNLVTIRHPNVIETMRLYCKEKKHINPLFDENFNFQNHSHICLAWGGKIKKDKKHPDIDSEELEKINDAKQTLVNDVCKILDDLKDCQFYVYGDADNQDVRKPPRHTSPSAFNNIKNPQLTKIDYSKIEKNF